MKSKLIGEPKVELVLSMREALLFRSLIGQTVYDEAVEKINQSHHMGQRGAATNRNELVDVFSNWTRELEQVLS